MHCLSVFLVVAILACVPCCGRTDLGTVVAGGAMAVGGVTATGGVLAAGGVPGGGGASGLGGSVSTSDLDTCSSDADCTTSCVWTTAPTDSSQCVAHYCCGSNWMSKRRCEANQTAWAIYCPNQSSTLIDCPCAVMCETGAQTFTFGCVGGKCKVVCSPPVGGAGGSTVIPLGSGGYSGNDGTGGNRGTGGSSNSGGSGGGGTGGSGTTGSGAIGGAGGTIGSSAVFGMPCASDQDCPSGATCCDGSSESCDDTRVPSGDGTDSGEFAVSSDGLTVTDTITGLIWQRDGSGTRAGCTGGAGGIDGGSGGGTTCTWAEAKAYCASLSLSGVSGWRLPAPKEISTILNLTATNLSIDQTACPNTPSEAFWTSSPYDGIGGFAWAVDCWSGISSAIIGDSYRVRCVRGSRCYPTSRFVALSGGLVSDTLTNLVWQRQASTTTMKWPEAQGYCSSMGSGFRLPTLKELFSLVDLTVTSGATIDQIAFPNTPAYSMFWSSSESPDLSGDAWFVDFTDGYSTPSIESIWYYVRCVR